ncbi:MAG: 16S rRNA (cytidine(1402)-2'-O)-methyltransferase [Burkholderiales bacterium]|nr:16S rRNA (cytidine(1402)-2'-O)-methyltransferase [Burkholderiales bacterium]
MLYICATPIGNLKDISLRALEILQLSDIILCEDTRTSKYLLNQHNIQTKRLIALHEHNEVTLTEKVISWLADGLTITQISDAGTPGISDPGARLCTRVRQSGFPISPLPGACAYISLLAVSGLSIPHLFYGFLPSKTIGRCKIVEQWYDSDYAICLYEAPHRIVDCITDIIKCLGPQRIIIMGRELTKQFETIVKFPADELLKFILSDTNQQKGEFVLIIEPLIKNLNQSDNLTDQQINTLKALLAELPPKKAVALTHKIMGGNKDLLYNYAINNKHG